MAERIRHLGVVDAIKGDTVRVRIVQTSACASCKVAGSCNASESKVKTVDVHSVDGAETRWSVGDTVVVSASPKVAARAMLFAFGAPFALMVAVLAAVLAAGGDETAAGLSALASLLPYFAMLYLFRRRIGRGVAFTITDDDAEL